MIYILDLFSGIGGFTLASQWVGGYMTLAFCEIEDYCRKVLSQNFPNIPIFTDVRQLHPTDVIPRDGVIHLITAGFPCQDLSVAGNQAGIEADRSGLFFQILRLSDEFYAYSRVRPSLLLENVPNLLTGNGGDWARTVYSELAVRGYRCEWKIISASDVGAPHLRKRWWCLAYMAHTKRLGWSTGSVEQGEDGGGIPPDLTGQCSEALSDSHSPRRGERWGAKSVPKKLTTSKRNSQKTGSTGQSECRLGGMVDGIPDWLHEPEGVPRVTTGQINRVSRLRGLGNSIVPAVAMIPLRRFKEIHEKQSA